MEERTGSMKRENCGWENRAIGRKKGRGRARNKQHRKQEIIDNHVFGYGDEHPLFKDIIGDYVGVAIDKYFFLQTPDYPLFKGHHAGALKEEASIPIIVIKN